MFDIYNGHHSIENTDALAHFEAAVAALARHRPGIASLLDGALAAEPNFIAAHVLKGFAGVLLAYRDYQSDARQSLQAAERVMEKTKPSRSEVCLVEALRLALDGQCLKAADVLEVGLLDEPNHFLLLKLSYGLRFMAGDPVGMLSLTSRVLPKWSPGAPAAGYVFGCHAFSLEEAGEFHDAERFGRRALALAPDDAWGLHAVCHVQEMQSRFDDGIYLIESSRKAWQGCNNFKFHVAWHLALFYLEAGRVDDVLALYDTEIRALRSDDYRDIANAVSLLQRLQQEGVDVGNRWDELAAIASARADETSLMFASLHQILALLACGQQETARSTVAAWQVAASTAATDQSCVANRVGLELGQILISNDKDGAVFDKLARQLPAIGGSIAQRDVFFRELVVLACQANQHDAAQKMLALRAQVRSEDRFHRTMIAKCMVERNMIEKSLAAQPQKALNVA